MLLVRGDKPFEAFTGRQCVLPEFQPDLGDFVPGEPLGTGRISREGDQPADRDAVVIHRVRPCVRLVAAGRFGLVAGTAERFGQQPVRRERNPALGLLKHRVALGVSIPVHVHQLHPGAARVERSPPLLIDV